jgi:HSP20 family protein
MTADTKPVPITRAAGEKPETAMVPAEPGWEPFLSLRREIDRLFDDMTWRPSRLFEMRPWTRVPTLPAADIVEKDGDFVMTLDVPGMDEKDIEVKLSDDAVTIRGEKTEEKEEEKEDYRLSERRHGSFVRTFSLPDSVDADKISATYGKGVVKLVMPKTDSAKRKQRKIEVKAA